MFRYSKGANARTCWLAFPRSVVAASRLSWRGASSARASSEISDMRPRRISGVAPSRSRQGRTSRTSDISAMVPREAPVRALAALRWPQGPGAGYHSGLMVETIEWTDAGVVMIDQTRLPLEETYVTCRTYHGGGGGDPQHDDPRRAGHRRGGGHGGRARRAARRRGRPGPRFETICETLAATRPTAVNLFWAIERMRRVYAACAAQPIEAIRRRLVEEAQLVREEDIAINRAIGRNGAPLVPDGKTVLTHCNAGALATAGYGTALGVIRAAVEAGKQIDVFADETRPFLQGARLTAWELQQRRHSGDADHRQHGRPFPEVGPHRLRGGGRGPHRGQRRRGQQDRHLLGGRAGAAKTACRFTWPRRFPRST